MRVRTAPFLAVFLSCICLLTFTFADSQSEGSNIIVYDIEIYTSNEGANIISSDSTNGKFSQCIEYGGSPDFSDEGYTSNRSIFIEFIGESGNQSVLTLHATNEIFCEELILTANGTILVVGTFSGVSEFLNHTSQNTAGFVISIDSNTFENRSYIFDTDGDDRFYGLTASSHGEFVVAGSTDGNISNFTTTNDAECGVNATSCGIVVFLDNHLEYDYLQFIESTHMITCFDVEQKGFSDSFLVTGYFSGTMAFNGSQIIPPSNQGTTDLFVSLIDTAKQWDTVNTAGGSGSFRPKDILYHQNEFLVFGEGIMDSTSPAFVQPSGDEYDHGLGGMDLVIMKVDNLGLIQDIHPIGTGSKDGSGEMKLFSTTSVIFSGYTGGAYDFNQSTIGEENQNNFFGGIYDLEANVVTFAFSSEGSSSSDARANTVAVVSNESFYIGGRAMPFESEINGTSIHGSERTGVGIRFSKDSDFDQIPNSMDNCLLVFNPNQNDFDSDSSGDACDADIDSDGIDNLHDPCNFSDIIQTDRDGDGCYGDEDDDDDGDGVIDEDDDCRGNQSQVQFGNQSDRDRDGCHDTQPGVWGEDEDDDGDSISDSEDECTGIESVVFDSESWVDSDADGCHDELGIGEWGEDDNDDNDAFFDKDDDCQIDVGNSTIDRKGCPDYDGDGYSNYIDVCGLEVGTSSEREIIGCPDWDKDGHANSYDKFPEDNKQWDDLDDDGFGDNPNGQNSDDCKEYFGTSHQSLKGCPDIDNDGWADSEDALPNDPLDYLDNDGDGIGNSQDDCPFAAGNSSADRVGCLDSDGDGFSDIDSDWAEKNGADAFPFLRTQWMDSDGDGYGDNKDGDQPDGLYRNWRDIGWRPDLVVWIQMATDFQIQIQNGL